MRRALELVLMVGGAFSFALGLDFLLSHAMSFAESAGLAALGWAALMLGVVLSLRAEKAPQPTTTVLTPIAETAAAPLGTATLAFQAGQLPQVLGSDPDMTVTVDGDGTVRFKLGKLKAEDRLVCRSSAASTVFFNTLRQDRREAAIKLIGPLPPVLRLELWDRGRLKKSA